MVTPISAGSPDPRFPAAVSPASRVFESLFSSFQNIGMEFFGNEEGTRKAISKNLTTPIKTSSSRFTQIFGSAEQQLSTYSEFDASYRQAIQKELQSGVGITKLRKRQLQAALKPHSNINLNLISSYADREELVTMFNRDVLQTGNLITNFGLPGFHLQSQNPFRETGQYLISTEGDYSPVGEILQGSTFQIDPRAKLGVTVRSAAESFRIGMSNLPSAASIKRNIDHGGILGIKDLAERIYIAFARR
jgi:hypothetical protein